MHAKDKSGIYVVVARLEMEGASLRKIAKGNHIPEEEAEQLEAYAQILDSVSSDMKLAFPTAF